MIQTYSFIIDQIRISKSNNVLSEKKYVPPGGSGSELCQTEESGAEQCPDGDSGGDSSKDIGSMGIIFLGIFVTGFANSLFYAFGKSYKKLLVLVRMSALSPLHIAGMPYIDDNSPRQSSPLRLSIALAARYCRSIIVIRPMIRLLLFCYEIYL